MKLALPLLATLLVSTSAPKPSARRIVASAVTATVYRRARATALVLPEKHLFPVKKNKGVITVSTTAGNKVFRDKRSPIEIERVTYDYLGYLPRVQQHLLRKSYWEGEERLVEIVLAVRRDGRVLEFDSEPIYSPSQKYAAVFWQFSDYNAMLNRVQLFEQQSGKLKLLWDATPQTWQPTEAFWATDSTVYLKQGLYKRRQAEFSNGVPYQPARFTYARLLVRPAVPATR